MGSDWARRGALKEGMLAEPAGTRPVSGTGEGISADSASWRPGDALRSASDLLGSPCVVLVSKSSAPSTSPGFKGPMGNDMPLPAADRGDGNAHTLGTALLLPERLLHRAPSAVLSPRLTPIGCLVPRTS